MKKPSTQIVEFPLIAEVSHAKRILDSINWDFSTPFSVGRSGIRLFDCRKHHWYPATFIPEIPYTLIEILSNPGAVVYDPFGGIGTTVFQALQLGRQPFVTELCSVTVDFMKSLWILFDPRTDLSVISGIYDNIKAAYNSGVEYSSLLKDSSVQVNRLRPWFALGTFNQLMYLVWCETKLSDLGTKAAMRICLSAILKTVCAQDRGWGCIADNVRLKPEQLAKEKNAIELFSRKLMILLNDVSVARKSLPSNTCDFLSSVDFESRILQLDVKQCSNIPDNSVDLIVTSPPYPNMTDYALSQRLSYYWLGGDPTDDLPSEIGARRKRNKSVSLQRYLEDMQKAEKVFCSKLKPGGYACFVMPGFEGDKNNNTARKQVVQECLAFLLSCNLVCEQELTRILPSRRRHHNQKWTTLEREFIYIYRKRS